MLRGRPLMFDRGAVRMKISAVTFEPCVQRQQDTDWKFARAAIPEVRGWTIRITGENGITGIGYGHALAAVTGHAPLRSCLRPNRWSCRIRRPRPWL